MMPRDRDRIEPVAGSAATSASAVPRRHPTAFGRKAPQPGTTLLPRTVWGDTQIQTRSAPWLDEARTRALWQALADMVFVVSRSGQVLEFHPPPDLEYPLAAEGLVGRPLSELVPAGLAQQVRYYLEKALRTGGLQLVQAELQVAGRLRTFQARLAPCGPERVLALVRDVTDRAHMEKELLDISHREQMRIGQDLHDGLGQHLTGITFLVRALEKKLAARQLPEAAEAAEVLRLVMQALAQTRNLARGLFPVELESKGLPSALRELAATVQQMFRIRCTAELDEHIVIADQAVATHLFRLAQEAVSNAIRHGKAKQVTLELSQAGDYLALSIRDDGVGLPPDGPPSSGLGLKIMQYRAQKVGGVLHLQPGPDGGTVVSCLFPRPAEPMACGTQAASTASAVPKPLTQPISKEQTP